MKLTELLRSTNLLKLIGVLSSIAILAIVITVGGLYQLALQQKGQLLAESLNNQVAFMSTMQQLEDSEAEKDENSDGRMILNAIRHMQTINRQSIESGRDTEYVVAQKQNGRIVFLLHDGHTDHVQQDHEHAEFSLPVGTDLATPMHHALAGETGITIGPDHHGDKVLAAYQYMPEHELGLVAKTSTNRLLLPYLAVLIGTCITAIAFIFVGAYAFAITVKPLYVLNENTARRIRKQHAIMSRLVEKKDADPCDMQHIFEEITEAACEGLSSTRASIWMYNHDHSSVHCAELYDQSSGKHDLSEDMDASDYPAFFDALKSGSVVVERNAAFDLRTTELAKDHLIPFNTRAVLNLAIRVEGDDIGIICAEQSNTERKWTLDDQNFARSIADHVAMAMTNCQRNKAETHLKESEQRYELAVTGSNDGLWDWDMSSNRVYRSPQFKKLLGYDTDELKDDYSIWLDHLHPEDRKQVTQALNAHLEDASKPYDAVYRLRTKSGRYRWFRGRGNALRDENGKPYRVSGSITDITDLKYTQDNLSRFKETLDDISENIFMFDPDTLGFFYVNKSAVDSTGYSEEELLNMSPVDIEPEFNETSFREMIAAIKTHPERPMSFETVHETKLGRQIPVEVNLQYIVPHDESPRFVFIVRDVSERRNAEIENYIQRTMLEHIHHVQDDFISGIDSKIVFEKLLNGFLDITESEYGLIGEVFHDDNHKPFLRVKHLTDVAWNEETRKLYESRYEQALEFHDLDNLIGSVITSGETVISNNPVEDPRYGGLPEGHPPLRRFIGIPLMRANNMIGIVGIANSDFDYSEDLIKRLQPLSSTCVNLIEAERTETLRNTMENALRTSEEKANTVLATVADGIITIDGHGIVESYNHAAENIFGYKASEVIGHNVNMLMPEPYHSEHDGYLERYMSTSEARILGNGREVDGKHKDGTVFPLDLSVSEIKSGDECRFTGVVRDISQRKQAELALIAAKDEAEQANRTKSEFLSSMSHELRTPLNAIMGFAQLLQFDAQLSSSQKKHAQEIYGAGNLLLDLINDVLDLAKIEAGHIDLTIDSVNLEQCLKNCFKLIKSQAEKLGIKLEYEKNTAKIDHCKDVWVRADLTRLKQVLLNLLSNAVKYNKKNGSVYICCPRTTEGFRRICITDSGRGIRKEDMENLFQPFNRLGAERGEIEGTGIGLVITRKLVELMGGTISVDSQPGEGTTFLIDLPESGAVTPIASDKTTQPDLHGNRFNNETRILIAEDNLTNQELITLQLDTLGFRSDVVSNGKEAVNLLQKHKYDLLLTDIHMPEMDGYQLTRAIRDSSDSDINEISIIAITANAAADEATRCLEKGMNDYLAKPVDINELQTKLGQWLPDTVNQESSTATGKIIYGAHAAAAAPTAQTSKDTAAIDPDTLSRYVGSDPDKQKHFFKLFLDTAPETIEAISNAYKERSLGDIKDTCHKLKSSARAIGAVKLSALCQNIETASMNEDWSVIDSSIPEVSSAMSDVEDYIHSQQPKKKETPEVQFNFDDVLIVDDDRFVLDLVTSRLNNIGINNVKTASSGEDALTFLNDISTPPSVLLLDLNMPGMDGVEFLRHLSELTYQGNIILISGEDTRLLRSAENIARDRKLNILGSLEKPVTIPSLTEMLILVGAEKTSRPVRSKISLTEADLRSGIDNDELIVYFQPQIDLNTMQLFGAEALVRWIHPERGFIPPDTFIPVAEELNLINEMTDIIFNKAMSQCSSWREQGLDINLSVNLSVDSLDRLDLPEYIVNCARENQLDVSKIMLEITESRLMQDITSALDILTRLSLKGIRLSIDDFGTGYSSMEQLQRIPFTELKIDRSFVNGALHNRAARAILESSVELAQKLNMTIVAEGVENEEDLKLVTGLGCTYVQGYYIGKPMPGDEMIGWHEDWKSNN